MHDIKANFISSEMHDPGRELPRAIHKAMAVVIICFGAVNVSYYIILPWSAVGSNDAVAVVSYILVFPQNLVVNLGSLSHT